MEISVKESYQQSEDLEDNLSIAVNRKASITRILIRHSLIWTRYTLERLPIKMTLSSLGIVAVALTIVLPRTVTYALLYPIFRLVFGNLYPAYASYKAVRTRNIKEYVKWMMYWIVFALFTCAETFTDVFLSFWFPFYYEIKTILVVWLLSPATRGSSILYRRFVHPILIQREAEIDEALSRATEQGYTAVLHLGSKGVNYATTVLMQTAIKQLLHSAPSTLNALPTSQSDTAISSLVNPRAITPTDTSSTKKDCQDGAVTPTTPSTPPSTSSPISDGFQQPFLYISEHDEPHALDERISEERLPKRQPSFKAPAKRSRKTRKTKEERAESARRQQSRSCKSTYKTCDPDFSDEFSDNYVPKRATTPHSSDWDDEYY